MQVSDNVSFEVRKIGEQKYHQECLFVMCRSMMRVSGNVLLEVSKRGEQKSGKECSCLM